MGNIQENRNILNNDGKNKGVKERKEWTRN